MVAQDFYIFLCKLSIIWHTFYSSDEKPIFCDDPLLLPRLRKRRAVDQPIFTTGSTYHPSLASSPTTMVPLPLPAVAYLCGPAVHFVLCFILQPEGAFDCPRCPGWCLLLCDAAAVVRNACAATCCCCAIYRCLLLLPAVFVAASVWREG